MTSDAITTPGIPRQMSEEQRAHVRHERARDVIDRTLSWTLSIALFLILWEVTAQSGLVNRRLFPTVIDTFGAWADLWTRGFMWADIRASLTRALVGFCLGGGLGVLVGISTGRLKPFDFILRPIVTLFRPIPAIAVVPVAVVWFGIGENSKYFVIAYSVFLSVWLNVHAGAASVSETHMRVARSLGAGRWRRFWEVVVPAAAPDIISGLRYGAAVAFIVLVAAELSGAQRGLGHRISISAEYLQTDRIFALLITLGVLGAMLDTFFRVISKRLVHWGER